jgi:hypothetical protein
MSLLKALTVLSRHSHDFLPFSRMHERALPAWDQHRPSTVGRRIEAITCQQPVAVAIRTRLGSSPSQRSYGAEFHRDPQPTKTVTLAEFDRATHSVE